jgi:hypothetical protein
MRTSNRYGKDPAEFAPVPADGGKPLLRPSATLEVVTTVPVARIADIVLDHVLSSEQKVSAGGFPVAVREKSGDEAW